MLFGIGCSRAFARGSSHLFPRIMRTRRPHNTSCMWIREIPLKTVKSEGSGCKPGGGCQEEVDGCVTSVFGVNEAVWK
jgi:hypothetical protein